MNEMNEMVQSEEVNLDGISLFGDSGTDQTSGAEGSEGASEAEATEGSTEEAQKEEAFLKVTYNGEERDLTAEEAKVLAQKGMNYDRIKEKADKADGYKRCADVIEKFAEAAGVSVEEYLEQAVEHIDNRKLRELTDTGMDEATARELLQLRAEKAAAERQKSSAAAEEKSRAEMGELIDYIRETNNGDIPKDMEHLPQELVDAISNGEKPLVAYLKMRAKQAAEKEAAINEANRIKQKSVGSARGTASTVHEDGFVKALFG